MWYFFSLSLQLRNCSVIFALRRESVHRRTLLLGSGCCLNNVGQPMRTWKSSSCDPLRFSLNGWGESRDLFCIDEVLCVRPLEAQFWHSPCLQRLLYDPSLETEGRRTVRGFRLGPGAHSLYTAKLRPTRIGFCVDRGGVHPILHLANCARATASWVFRPQFPSPPMRTLEGSGRPLSP